MVLRSNEARGMGGHHLRDEGEVGGGRVGGGRSRGGSRSRRGGG